MGLVRALGPVTALSSAILLAQAAAGWSQEKEKPGSPLSQPTKKVSLDKRASVDTIRWHFARMNNSDRLPLLGGVRRKWSVQESTLEPGQEPAVESRDVNEPGIVQDALNDLLWLLAFLQTAPKCEVPGEHKRLEQNLESALKHLAKAQNDLNRAFNLAYWSNRELAWKDKQDYQNASYHVHDELQKGARQLEEAGKIMRDCEEGIDKLLEKGGNSEVFRWAEMIISIFAANLDRVLDGVPPDPDDLYRRSFRGVRQIAADLKAVGLPVEEPPCPNVIPPAPKDIAAKASLPLDNAKLAAITAPWGADQRTKSILACYNYELRMILDPTPNCTVKVDRRAGAKQIFGAGKTSIFKWVPEGHCIAILHGAPMKVNGKEVYSQEARYIRIERGSQKGTVYVCYWLNFPDGTKLVQTYRIPQKDDLISWFQRNGGGWKIVPSHVNWISR